MTINTRDFGELTINDEEIIAFDLPIFGFDEDSEYVILIDDESDGMFSFLQSVKNPEVCFVLTDPALIFENYKPSLLPQTKKALGVNQESDAVFRVITVIPDDFLNATVNLKSPIVICPSTKRGEQIILDDDYPLRALLCETEG